MAIETLQVSTQYNDLKGRAAADIADEGGYSERLRQNGRIGGDEFVVGINFYIRGGMDFIVVGRCHLS